mgnify:CR=1 FL=1
MCIRDRSGGVARRAPRGRDRASRILLSTASRAAGPVGRHPAAGHRPRGRPHLPQAGMTGTDQSTCRRAGPEAPNGADTAPSGSEAVPSADLRGVAPPGGPRRRQARPPGPAPADPAGPTPSGAATRPRLDFRGATRCPPQDGDQAGARPEEGRPAALPPGALRPFARAVVAAAIELRDDLLLVPVCSRSPRVD